MHTGTVSEGKYPGRSRVTRLGTRDGLTFANTAAWAKNRPEPQGFGGTQYQPCSQTSVHYGLQSSLSIKYRGVARLALRKLGSSKAWRSSCPADSV